MWICISGKIMEAEAIGQPQTQGKSVLDPVLEKLRENMRQQFPLVNLHA